MSLPVVLLTVVLSGCTGDDPGSSSSASPSETPLTEVTVDCPEFTETAAKITDAQTALYTGAGGSEAIDDLVAELDGLKEGAPDDVQTALTDLGDAFRDAAEILENPTPENQSRLAELSPKLAEDGQKVTEYIQDQCE